MNSRHTKKKKKKLYKGEGKSNIKKGVRSKSLQKRLERGSLSWCSVNVFYCICSYT